MSRPNPATYSAPPDDYDLEIENGWADHEAQDADDYCCDEDF